MLSTPQSGFGGLRLGAWLGLNAPKLEIGIRDPFTHLQGAARAGVRFFGATQAKSQRLLPQVKTRRACSLIYEEGRVAGVLRRSAFFTWFSSSGFRT